MVSVGVGLVLLLQFSLPALCAPRAGCTISINSDISEPQPLILNPKGGDGNDAFYLPDNGDTITLSENQLVDLACPGGDLLLDGTSTNSATGQVQCSSGRFSIGTSVLPFRAITCSSLPRYTARSTGNTCASLYQELEIGFQIESRFLRSIRVCFDENLQQVLFSEFNLTETIAGYQTAYPRSSWAQSSFFDVGSPNVNTLYTRNQQRITINTLLGLPTSDYKYIARSSDFYLARGHLSAKADFLYGSVQRSTFYFINAAPQWQTFNAVNWGDLEDSVRNFASSRSLDLIVYTGTYGVTTLPHEQTGVDTELYLYVDGTRRGIPVPRLFWKVLYEPTTKAGVVFIGVNNPYVLKAEDMICSDVCNQHNWLTWKPSNVTLGYGYCCSVEEFRKTVTTLPMFDVQKLLV